MAKQHLLRFDQFFSGRVGGFFLEWGHHINICLFLVAANSEKTIMMMDGRNHHNNHPHMCTPNPFRVIICTWSKIFHGQKTLRVKIRYLHNVDVKKVWPNHLGTCYYENSFLMNFPRATNCWWEKNRKPLLPLIDGQLAVLREPLISFTWMDMMVQWSHNVVTYPDTKASTLKRALHNWLDSCPNSSASICDHGSDALTLHQRSFG